MGNQLELRHFRYFLALAETLHFRKAAEQLYISQPALSRQIQQLEQQLGFPLFARNNKQVELTAAGRFLQSELALVLKQISNVLDQAGEISKGVLGSIRMGYVGSAMQNIIPELFGQFKTHLPGIQFSLQEMDNNQQVEGLLSREIDLGFVRLQKVPATLVIRPVWEETFSLVVPLDYPLAKDGFRDLSTLRKEPFILFEEDYSPSYYAKVMSIFSDSGFTPIVAHKTVHANTIYRLVENGFGISIVPTSLQKGYQPSVRFIELPGISQRAVLSVIWNKENQHPVLPQILEMVIDIKTPDGR